MSDLAPEITARLDNMAAASVGAYPKTALLLLVILVILVIWLWRPRAEGVSTGRASVLSISTGGQQVYNQEQDTVALGRGLGTGSVKTNGYEFAMNGAPSGQGAMMRADAASFGGGDIHGILSAKTDPSSSSFPGSPSWQVLNSPAFGCDSRVAASDDAWAWQSGVARENASNAPRVLESASNAPRVLGRESAVAGKNLEAALKGM
jgi:hypothetical protein